MKSLSVTFLIYLLVAPLAWGAEDEVHRSGVSNLQNDGWHLAVSTEGKYSVLVPWPFTDVTVNGSSAMYTIISPSKDIASFTATLIPKDTQPGVFKTFTEDLDDPSLKISKYKDRTSIYGKDEMLEQGFEFNLHTKRIKADEGIYVMMALVQTKNEDITEIEKFLNSLEFNSTGLESQ